MGTYMETLYTRLSTVADRSLVDTHCLVATSSMCSENKVYVYEEGGRGELKRRCCLMGIGACMILEPEL